jgi:uncharacterized protein
MTNPVSGGAEFTARLGDAVTNVGAAAWNNCAGNDNPFVSHAFLAALEASGSATSAAGWQPVPILIEESGILAGALPAYIKSHSQGEYVFDHNWADAYQNSGGDYYPKLQIASPFSPVPGPRILARDALVGQQLLAAAEAVVGQYGLSSAHATFVEAKQLPEFEAAGWLLREGVQFHWANNGYSDFDGFLNALSSRKRKAIRKERATAQGGLSIRQIAGRDITEAHWDAFWHFYQDTGARKWGRPYLTRAFFSIIGETMADELLLFLAEHDGVPIAGALNMIGSEALYGRYWGCSVDVPFLHFELCYYQAIDWAIAHGKARVEAGAQGEHKLARGYVAVPTWSAHYIADPNFRRAIADFLVRERRAMERQIEFLGDFAPFKKSP